MAATTPYAKPPAHDGAPVRTTVQRVAAATAGHPVLQRTASCDPPKWGIPTRLRPLDAYGVETRVDAATSPVQAGGLLPAARSRNGVSRSIGAGKTIVVACDEPSSSSVWR